MKKSSRKPKDRFGESIKPPEIALRYSDLQLKIEPVAIDNVVVPTRHVRDHSNASTAKLGRSIAQFGFVAPVIVNQDNELITGVGRYYAAKWCGMTHLPVIRLEHLSPAQLNAYKLADNRLAENASWNDEIVSETIRIIKLSEPDFDLSLTGFSVPELDRFQLVDDMDEDDTIPAAPTGPVVSRIGDMYRLGPHYLLCADARDMDSYRRLLDDRRVRMVFADGPYNVPMAGHVTGLGQRVHRPFPMGNGEWTKDEFLRFQSTFMGHLVAYSLPGAIHIHAMDWRGVAVVIVAGEQHYEELLNIGVWAKPQPGMGSFLRSQHELFPMFRVAGGPHLNNVEMGKHGRNRSNLWSYAAYGPFGRATSEGDLSLHPTPKPVSLVADLMLDCTHRGDVVLDPFLGSGTTLIAAERTGRIAAGLELDPAYCDVIIRRWEKETGQSATHVVTGQSLDELAIERGAENG